MLSQEADQRPNVQEILRTDYIRGNIRLFLEKAAERKQRKRKIPSSKPADKELKVDIPVVVS